LENEDAMLRGHNLYFSRLIRIALVFCLSALTVQAFSQLAPAYSHDPVHLFPSVGGRPEFLTVFDLRQVEDPAERILAKSVQGLYNTAPVNHDKIYLILNDRDANLVDWLVKQQFVLSTGYPKSMEELMLRWPSRDAVTADATSLNAASAVAGCKRLLIATDPSVIEKYHLNVVERMSGRWTSEADADRWLLKKYGDQINTHVLAMPSNSDDLSLVDYGIANRVFTFRLGDGSDQVLDALRTKFDSNIPCLSSQSADTATLDPATKQLSENADFLVPIDGLSNLSVWTTFHVFNPLEADIYWGAVHNPRRYIANDFGEMRFDVEPYKEMAFSARDLAWLRNLAPPLFESTSNLFSVRPEDRDAFRIGIIDEGSYGMAFGADRDRIWTNYLELSRNAFDSSRQPGS
jgi:hypothetical protein